MILLSVIHPRYSALLLSHKGTEVRACWEQQTHYHNMTLAGPTHLPPSDIVFADSGRILTQGRNELIETLHSNSNPSNSLRGHAQVSISAERLRLRCNIARPQLMKSTSPGPALAFVSSVRSSDLPYALA